MYKFTKSFSDVQIILKIWDNYFLEGDYYLLKVAFAIIKYLENKLIQCPLCSDLPNKLFKESLIDIDYLDFFKIIENINLPY